MAAFAGLRPAGGEGSERPAREAGASGGGNVGAGGEESAGQLWREARDRRLAQVPRNPIDEALWANFQAAMEKAKAEKRDSEARSQEPEGRTEGTEAENERTGNRGQESRSRKPEMREKSPNRTEPRVPNPESRTPKATGQGLSNC